MYATHYLWLTDASTGARVLINMARITKALRETSECPEYTVLYGDTFSTVTETLDEIALALGIGPRPESDPFGIQRIATARAATHA